MAQFQSSTYICGWIPTFALQPAAALHFQIYCELNEETVIYLTQLLKWLASPVVTD